MDKINFEYLYNTTYEDINNNIKQKLKGVYVLGKLDKDKNFIPELIERSDTDIRKSILDKNINSYDKFWYKETSNIKDAFILECELSHKILKDTKHKYEKPKDTNYKCPYCEQFPEIEYFLRYYENIIVFSTDTFTDEESDIEHITEDRFYKELYIDRDIEEEIIKQIFFKPAKTIAFIGPRGCGKSTTGLRVLNRIKRENKCLPIFINSRMIYGTSKFDNIEEDNAVLKDTRTQAREFIRTSIISVYKEQIEKNDLLNDIFENIIIPDKREVINKTGLFTNFREEFDYIYYKYHSDFAKRKCTIDFKKWITENYLEIKSYLDIIIGKLDIQHYCVIFKKYFHFKYQIVWFDNVDALPDLLQYWMIDSLNEIQASIPIPIIIFIISIREENVHRFEDYDDDDGYPDIIRIYWKDKKTNKLIPDPEKEIKAINQRIASSKVLKEIISTRLKYSQYKYIPKFTNQKYDFEEFKEFTKVIDDKFYNDVLIPISNKILSTFESTHSIYIANNSITNYMLLHKRFLEYLLSKDFFIELSDYYKNRYYAEKFTNPQMITEFYRWLSSPLENSGLYLFDLIDHIDILNHNQNKLSCFLPFICLSTIWNLTLINVQKEIPVATCHNPRVDEIIKKLKFIGYNDANVIKKMLLELYLVRDNERESFISIRANKFINKINDIEDDMLVRLTYRGKSILCSVVNSYGYLIECTIRKNFNELVFDQEKQKQSLIMYLCDLTNHHLSTLNSFCAKPYIYKKGWVNDYLNIYGIPQRKPYSRKTDLGLKTGDGRFKAFYLQTVFSSLLGHFNNPDNKGDEDFNIINSKILDLENLFNDYIDLLNEGKQFDVSELAEAISAIKRK